MMNGTGAEDEKPRSVHDALILLVRSGALQIGKLFRRFHCRRVCSEFINSHDLAGSRRAFFFQSEFLVNNKYAGPGKVAISGASNGGQTPTLVSVLVLSS